MRNLFVKHVSGKMFLEKAEKRLPNNFCSVSTCIYDSRLGGETNNNYIYNSLQKLYMVKGVKEYLVFPNSVFPILIEELSQGIWGQAGGHILGNDCAQEWNASPP